MYQITQATPSILIQTMNPRICWQLVEMKALLRPGTVSSLGVGKNMGRKQSCNYSATNDSAIGISRNKVSSYACH